MAIRSRSGLTFSEEGVNLTHPPSPVDGPNWLVAAHR
jgi:hypothetical protein